MLSDDQVERVLVVTAHPDDLDFGASGTIATFVGLGIQVSYCICTDGDAGGFDPYVPRSEIPGIRQREQRAAGAVLGVDPEDIYFLGHPDGTLTADIELRRDISRIIRQVRPQRVLCHSPDRNYDRIYASHPDHLAAGEAALCAVYPDARNPFAHPALALDGFDPWTVPEVWVMGGQGAQHTVDITDHFEKKLDALMAHVSQTEHVGREQLAIRMHAWNGEVARLAGLPEGHLAETFRVVDTQ